MATQKTKSRTDIVANETCLDNSIIKLCALNVNSIGSLKRRYDLQEFINTNNINIAMVSETTLNNKHKLKFDNHTIIRTDRPNRNGGGTAIIADNKLEITTITTPNSLRIKLIEYTAIKVAVNANKTLIIISIYAAQRDSSIFIKELNDLFEEFNLKDNNIYYIIAGDLNARNEIWGDSTTNNRGRQLQQWEADSSVINKAIIYSANLPTYPRAGSYLDYCIADARLKITDNHTHKISTTPYDSDHNALVFALNTNCIFNGNITVPLRTPTPNYKKANWRKFQRRLNETHHDEHCIPKDRNLTKEEIDSHILKP